MTELTQDLLLLDSQTDSELKMANSSVQKITNEADTFAKELMNQAKQRIEQEKENDLSTLSKQLKEQEDIDKERVDQQMKIFDEALQSNALVDSLLSIVKARTCP